MNIVELLREQVRAHPDAPAIIEGRRTRVTTFRQLEDAAGRVAYRLAKHGLEPGDAVLIYCPISAELYALLIGLFQLGLVAMFVDPQSGRAHLERCCRLQPPKAFVGPRFVHLLRLLSPGLRSIPNKFGLATGLFRAPPILEPGPCLHDICPRKDDAPALLTFTSGSTGQPKAAVRSHGLLIAQHSALRRALHHAPGEIDLTTLPIFVLANLASGVASLIPDADLRKPGQVDAGRIRRQLQAYPAATTVASPAFLRRLIGEESGFDSTLSFQRIYTGGAPVFPNLLAALQAACPKAEIVAVYGSTEAEPIAHVSRNEITPTDLEAMHAGRGLMAGCPVPEIQVRIIRDRWGQPLGRLSADALRDECQPVGEPGEIVVSGPHVIPGYLQGIGDEECKFEAAGTRWHRTGDAGYFDERGRLWLLGRCAAKIDDTFGVIYPFAVECAAMIQPGVRRTALVALRGKRVLVIERSKSGAFEPAELLRQVSWANVDRIKLVPSIPVDSRHNAKVDYARLRRLIEN